MSEQQEQDIEMLEIVLRNKQHTNVYADYEFSAIQRLLDRIRGLEQQRDATLKLADKWEVEAKDTFKSNTVRFAFYGCADELRAIFAPKEGK